MLALMLAWAPIAQAEPAQAAQPADPSAQPAEPSPPPAEPSPKAPSKPGVPAQAPPAAQPGVLAGTLAVFPGLVVPGLGHRIAKDRRTGSKLLRIGGAGWLAAIAGVGIIGGTGASRRLTPGLIPLVVGGVGMGLMTWSADIYGSFGGAGIGGAPRLYQPRLTFGAGYLYVHDPQFVYDHFTDLAAAAALGAWRGNAAIQLDPGAENYRARLGAAYRVSGSRPGVLAKTGSFLDIRTAVNYHHFGRESFAMATAELAAAGRYDLASLSPSLRGGFAELELGLLGVLTDYQVSDVGTDRSVEMLLRFAYGVYVGQGQTGGFHGEARIFYEHRRDDFAGGLATRPGSSGFIGGFGTDATVFFNRSMGAGARFQIGSAYVAGLMLLYQVE